MENLKDALKEADNLGCLIRKIPQTGEIQVKVPGRKRTLRINLRRKDCPRGLHSVLQQLRKRNL